jgi:hypothetical protein
MHFCLAQLSVTVDYSDGQIRIFVLVCLARWLTFCPGFDQFTRPNCWEGCWS